MAARGSNRGTLRITVVGDDKDLDRTLKSADRKLGRFGAAAAAAVIAMGAVSVKAFADFDQAMTRSTAIMGDVSDAMRGDMADAAREIGRTTRFGATEAAEAYFFLASAGLDAAASIDALPRVAAFAQAGNFDLARATDLLTDAQSALGLAVDDSAQNMQNMTRVSDVLVGANTLANASVEEFSEALTNKAGAAMRNLSIDIEEGVAVLAVYADQGRKGSEAGTMLNATLEGLTRTARDNAGAYQDLGIAVFDTEGEMRNMGDIVGDLEGALAGMSTEQQLAELANLGLTRQAMDGTRALLGSSDAIRDYESELRSAGGITDEIANNQMQTLAAQAGLLKDRFHDWAIEAGSRLAPALEGLISIGIGLFDAFDGLDPAMQTTIITAGAVGVAAGGLYGAFVAARAAAAALGIELVKLNIRMGIIGAAASVIGAAVGWWMGKNQEANERVAELTATLDEQTGALTDASRDWAFLQLEQAGAIDAARQLGVSTSELVDHVMQGGDAAALLSDRFMELHTAALESGDGMELNSQQASELSNAIAQVASDFDEANREFADQRSRQAALDDFKALEEASEFLGHEIDETDTYLRSLAQMGMAQAAEGADGMGGAIDEAGGAYRDFADDVDESTSALREHADTLREQHDPLFAMHRAVGRLTDAEGRFNDVLSDTSASQRDVEETALDLLNAQLDLAGAAGDAAGVFDGKLDPSLAATMRNLGSTDRHLGIVEGAFRDMGRQADAASVGRLTSVRVANMGSTMSEFRRLEREANHIARPRSLRVTAFLDAGRYNRAVSAATRGQNVALHTGGFLASDGIKRMHDGGAIDMLTTPFAPLRHDEVPIIAQTGELMLSRSDVAALQQTFRNLPRMHDGGIVGGDAPATLLPPPSGGRRDNNVVVAELSDEHHQLMRELIDTTREFVDAARERPDVTIEGETLVRVADKAERRLARRGRTS